MFGCAGEKDQSKKDPSTTASTTGGAGGGAGQQQMSTTVQHVSADITSPMSPAMSQSTDQPITALLGAELPRQDSLQSSVSMSASVVMAPDTQKFINFAGTHCFVYDY